MNIHKFYVDRKQPPSFISMVKNAFPEAEDKNLGANSGDLVIELDNKLVIIEVKEVPHDFLASITDARLFRQSEGIKRITPFAFLLLSQDFDYNKQWEAMGRGSNGYGPLGNRERPWTREHIDGALTSVMARGLMVRVAYRGYVEAIRGILRWADTCDNGSVTQEGIKLSPFDQDDQESVNLLAWFRGIGVIQSKNFLAWAHRNGKVARHELFRLASTYFESDDKPIGWTNHTIERNREQLEYPKKVKPKTEWVEALDIEVDEKEQGKREGIEY